MAWTTSLTAWTMGPMALRMGPTKRTTSPSFGRSDLNSPTTSTSRRVEHIGCQLVPGGAYLLRPRGPHRTSSPTSRSPLRSRAL